MKKLISILCLMTVVGFAYAQDSMRQSRVHYFFTINSGMLAGEPKGTSIGYTTSTVHGVIMGKRLRMGAGIGFDSYYQWQALPVFGQLSYDLIVVNKNALYAQVGYGWSHAWMQRPEGTTSFSSSGGKMFNAMLGYRLTQGKMSVTLGLGYKFQAAVSQSQYWYDSGFVPYPPTGYGQRTEIGLERFVVTIGVGWR